MKRRILVIDDNTAIHADIRRILTRADKPDEAFDTTETSLFGESMVPPEEVEFEVDSATQGEEGCEIVRQSVAHKRPFTLAFVDVQMSLGWDGIETIRRLWEIDRDVQIVICTAYSVYSWEDIRRKIHRSDSLLILKKPFDNVEVFQLAHALTKKWVLTQTSKLQLSNLDKIVGMRTEELEIANRRLTQEIAERNETENELRRSEERFAKAFKSSPIPMSIQSLRDYRYLDVNNSYLEMTGYSRAEILGASSPRLGLWANEGVYLAAFEQLRNGKAVRNVEGRIRQKNGEEHPTLFSGEQIHLGSEPFALMSEHDISERLHLESQLRQAQKMEAIGHLAAGVAHDFRNILTVIQGHANLRLLTPGLDPQMSESLIQIDEAVERASKLTAQLLAFGRKQIMQLEVLNLNQLVENLSRMLTRLIGEQITLNCSYFENIPLVEADACSIEQVIVNLAVNARDAMPQGGRLDISTGYRQIEPGNAPKHSEASAGKYAFLKVSDTGCGMDQATKQRLFEPFFTTKEVGKGTGMGLATAYGVIKQHKGWIEVESKPGHGATFSLFIPVTEKAHVNIGKKPNLSDALGGNETILVVEDEEPVRRFVSELLRQYGYEVLVASNGLEALDVWNSAREEIDLLLTDLVMPHQVSGLELASRLLQDRSDLKVIYTSGYSRELLDRHFDSPAEVNFLPKPYHPLKLAQAVRSCLDS